MVKFLNEIKEPKISELGGKGYSLAILTKNGFNVPKGFVIVSTGFFEYLKANNLMNMIKKLTSEIDENNFQEKCKEIKDLILSGEISEEIKSEVKENLEKLNAQYISVRSSAVSEDSFKASFAGLHDTFLNVKADLDTVLENLKKCWASLFNERAIVYRIKKKIPHLEEMAVVIQEMIPAEISGTAFTIHPDTEDKNTIIIESSWGIGESIVSGLVTPDRYIVNKKNFKVIKKIIGRKKITVMTDKNGVTRIDTPDDKMNAFSLNYTLLENITKDCLNIEKLFGYPQDIEWCIQGNRIWVLQSRAITSLGGMKEYKQTIKWKKTVTRPTSPLKASSLMEGLGKGNAEIIGIFLNNHLLEPVGEKHAWYVDEEEWTNFVKRISELCKDTSYLEKQAEDAYRICGKIKDITAKIRATDFQNKSNERLKDLLNEYHKSLYKYSFVAWGMLVIDQLLVGKVAEKLQTALKNRNKGEKFNEYFETLTTKVNLTDAEREEIELLNIKAEAQKRGDDIERLLKEHADKYGWLPMYDHDIVPWDKEYFRNRIISLSENPQKEIAQREEKLNKRRGRIEEILHELNDPELSRLVNLLQKYIILRTYRTDILKIAYYNMNLFFKEIENRMGLEGNEVAYTTIDEIFNFLTNGKVISKEIIKERMEHFLFLKIDEKLEIVANKDRIDNVLKNQLDRLELSDVLKGSGVYTGIKQGGVKIIESVKDEYKMHEGDILVATMTTPEMHSIIEKAGAIVTDEGGITCHAAVVAREFKIPCVIGTKYATKVLKDGDLVEVNAKEGIVRRLKI